MRPPYQKFFSRHRDLRVHPCDNGGAGCVVLLCFAHVCLRQRVLPFLLSVPDCICMATLVSWAPSVPIIAGLRCRPGVHPCNAPRLVQYALGREPGLLPEEYPTSGVVAPWCLPGSHTVIVPRACHRHATPCVVCVLELSQLVVLASARRPTWPTQFGDFPENDAPDAQQPPPASKRAGSWVQSHNLLVWRSTLGSVQLAGDPNAYVSGKVVQF